MMTREEANKHLHDDWYIENGRLCVDGDKKDAFLEAVGMGIKALRPVGREQVEKVFPGCPMCENGPPKIHIPAFRANAICNQHMNHEAFDLELNSKFCLNCGRPLTDEAVEMVMERLEALYERNDD